MFLAMGGNALLRGTAGLAQLWGMSAFLLGLVVVGFGTSTPQLFTAMQVAVSGTPTLALATAVGASIFNIFATLGIVALSGGAVHLNVRLWVRGSLALALIACGVAGAVTFFTLSGMPLPRWFGILCLAGLAVYVIAANAYDHKHPTPVPMLKQLRKFHPLVLVGLFVGGLLALILGANLLVDVTTQLTTTHNISPNLLGLTVLAVGTALPQLVASFMAYNDKQHGLLLNNLVGSTIFNLLGICGFIIAIKPMQLTHGVLLSSFIILAAATIAFLIFTHPAMRRFKRAEAILFILAYILYLAYVIHTLYF